MAAWDEPRSLTLPSADPDGGGLANDVYFREGRLRLASIHGGELDAGIDDVTFVLIKPEAFVARIAHDVIDQVCRRGFHVAGFVWTRLTRHVSRALWTFQWDVATVDRMLVADRLNGAGPSLLVLLVPAAGPRGEEPAALRLARQKGSAVPCERRPGDLRSVLGAPNRMMTHVHLPDGPADVVRELSILCADGAELEELFAAWPFAADRKEAVHEVIGRAHETSPRNQLDLQRSLARLRELRFGPVACRRHLDELEQACDGADISWDGWLRGLTATGTADPWDLLTVATSLVRHDRS